MTTEVMVWGVVALINLATFLIWGWDKRCARLDRRRVPEKTLLGWAFATGWIGAWVGVSTFRHKTKKWSFRWRLMLLTLVNPFWLVVWWQVDALTH